MMEVSFGTWGGGVHLGGRTEGGKHTPFARVNALFRRIQIVCFHQPISF